MSNQERRLAALCRAEINEARRVVIFIRIRPENSRNRDTQGRLRALQSALGHLASDLRTYRALVAQEIGIHTQDIAFLSLGINDECTVKTCAGLLAMRQTCRDEPAGT